MISHLQEWSIICYYQLIPIIIAGTNTVTCHRLQCYQEQNDYIYSTWKWRHFPALVSTIQSVLISLKDGISTQPLNNLR